MRWLTSAWSSVPSRGGCGEALAASRTTSWSLAAATRWTTALTLTAATARRWASWRASWGATATRSARSRPSRRSRRWPWRASWSSRMLLPRRALLVRPCWARELPAGPTRWSSSRRASSASSSWTRATGTWSSWPTVPLPPGVRQRWTPARPRSASCRMCWSRCPWTSRRLGARRRRRRSSTRSCFGPTSWGRLWAWTAWRRRALVLLARRASGLSSRRPTPRACRPTSPPTWCGTRWSSDVRRGGPRRAQGLAQKLGAPFDCPGGSSA
mmetsp:Transcript_27179/g.71078  ORF Transcript_27179/g.71078 Transcript_27179/m.71078 type:complete len:270 (+) Transcript_27179:173-982(+)